MQIVNMTTYEVSCNSCDVKVFETQTTLSCKEQWPQVYDGISVSECACHGGITYTYTAGTLVGGMIELHLKTNNLTSTSTSTSMIGLHLKTNNSTSAVGNSHDSYIASDDYLSLAIAIASSVIRC